MNYVVVYLQFLDSGAHLIAHIALQLMQRIIMFNLSFFRVQHHATDSAWKLMDHLKMPIPNLLRLKHLVAHAAFQLVLSLIVQLQVHFRDAHLIA